MSKSIKYADGYYLDSSSVVHERIPLNKLLNRSLMQLKIESGIGLSTTDKLVRLTEGDIKTSNDFSISDNMIKIDGDVNLIRLSVNIGFQDQGTTGGQRRLTLKKNNTNMVVSYSRSNGGAQYASTTVHLDTLLEVKKDDIISLYANIGVGSDNSVYLLSGIYSSVLIEKIK